MLYISANNEDIPSKITPVMQGNMVNAQKSNDLENQGQGQTHKKPLKSPFEK